MCILVQDLVCDWTQKDMFYNLHFRERLDPILLDVTIVTLTCCKGRGLLHCPHSKHSRYVLFVCLFVFFVLFCFGFEKCSTKSWHSFWEIKIRDNNDTFCNMLMVNNNTLGKAAYWNVQTRMTGRILSVLVSFMFHFDTDKCKR